MTHLYIQRRVTAPSRGHSSDGARQTHDFDAVVLGGSIAIDPDQTATWSFKAFPGGENYVHCSNPTVDSLLEQAANMPPVALNLEDRGAYTLRGLPGQWRLHALTGTA